MSETATEKKASLEGLANLSSEDFMNSIFLDEGSAKKEESAKAVEPVAEKKEDEKKEIPIVSDTKDIQDGKTTPANEPADKKEDAEKYKGKTPEEIVVLKATETEEKPFVPEFKIEGEVSTEAEKDGWIELAKEIGFELPEDKEELFKEKLDEHYKGKYEAQLGKYAPEAQQLIEFLNNGGTLESFREPLKPVNELKALSDVDLITKDLELRKWPEDKIVKEITRMTENDEIETSAFKLRESLDRIEHDIKEKVISQQLKSNERHTKFKATEGDQQLAAVKTSLNTVSEYMETPISDKHRNYIAEKFKAGKYADLLKDPKAIADYLLYNEFGKTGISNIKNNAENKAKLKYKSDRHNIPPIQNPGGSATSESKTSKEAAGNWGALEGFNDVVFGQKNN